MKPSFLEIVAVGVGTSLLVPAAQGDAVPKGLSAQDWSTIRAARRDERYRFGFGENGTCTAWNPSQGWLTFFDGRGFLTTPERANWLWGLETTGYGFPGETRCLPSLANPSQSQGRLEYARDAVLTEWFVNDARGLEQGWTLASRPPSQRAHSSIEVHLLIRGGLRTRVCADGASVSFLDEAGVPTLDYAGLKAFDTDGKVLPVRFESAGKDTLIIAVGDRGARYPITIDPVAQKAYLKASNTEASDLFGAAVAISGNTIVVGAPQEGSGATGVNGSQTGHAAEVSGAAYVFVRSGTGWTQEAYIKASNTGAHDLFGSSVAIDGDTLVVGAYEEGSNAAGVDGNQGDNSAPDSGAAYVFVRNGTTWTQQAYLKASNPDGNSGVGTYGDRFGWSVGISGNSVVVGALNEDSTATGVDGNQGNGPANRANAGAAYVFARTGTTWTQQAYLKASNAEGGQLFGGGLFGGGDVFGSSVSISGNTLVVGAPQEDSAAVVVNGGQDNNAASDSGAAYVFVRNGTTWTQQAYLKAFNAESNDLFGAAVAISEESIVVGAYGEDSNAKGVNGDPTDGSMSRSGAAYVFVRNGDTWSQQAYLKASNTGTDDVFGIAVALSGDTLVAGATAEDSNATVVDGDQLNNSASRAGAAYVFTRSGTAWSQRAYVKAFNAAADDNFGVSVGVSGDTAVAGAYYESSNATGVNGDKDNNSATRAGAAYVYDLGTAPNVPQEGGVRNRVTIPSALSANPSVVLFVDTNGDGQLSGGETPIPALSVRAQRENGSDVIYFTPPGYAASSWGGELPEAGVLVSLRIATASSSLTLPGSLFYTKDVVAGLIAVRAGLRTAFLEAEADASVAKFLVSSYGQKAGATAETILEGLFRRAIPLNQPGGSSQHDTLTKILETIPTQLCDYINGLRPAGADFAALVLPLTKGHTLHDPVGPSNETVLLTLGTGTLAMKDGADLAPGAVAPSGGRLRLPRDGDFYLIPSSEAHGWTFTMSVNAEDGVQVENLRITSPPSSNAVEQVGRNLSVPSMELIGGTYSGFYNLEQQYLSHTYINPNLDLVDPDHHPGEGHGPSIGWMLAAVYRVHLDRTPVVNNLSKPALVARQSYTFTSPFDDFEPSHGLLAATSYPCMTASISGGGAAFAGPSEIRISHRFALTPQETGTGDRYIAGFFRDRDFPEFYLTGTAVPLGCQALPFWFSMFEASRDTNPLIETEMRFDTDASDLTYPTPDNVHWHHVHGDPFSWVGALDELVTEAPGSFDGTIHCHWRWGKAYGAEFGNGMPVLPDNQQWLMALARAGVATNFTDFIPLLSNAPIKDAEKVLLVRCDQKATQIGRQYYTFSTGFSVALGSAQDGLEYSVPRFLAELGGGYRIAATGFGSLPPEVAVADEWRQAFGYVMGDNLFTPVYMLYPKLALLYDFFVGKLPTLRIERSCAGGQTGGQGPPAGVGGQFASVGFEPTPPGTRTPASVTAGTTVAAFTSTPTSTGFLSQENVFESPIGRVLGETPGTAGNTLTVSFDSPVRQVRNLPIAIRSQTGSSGVTIEMFAGAASLGSVQASAAVLPGGRFAETSILLDPGRTFDRFSVRSNNPARELAIGGFQITQNVIPPGDFDYDGQVDETDVRMLQAAFTGSSKSAPFWASESDLDHDGDIDAADYTTLLTKLQVPPPGCAIVVDVQPPAVLHAVAPGTAVPLAMVATDLAGGTITYQWSAARGSFTNAFTSSPTWTAPVNVEGEFVSVILGVKVQSSGGCSVERQFLQPVVSDGSYAAWAASFGLTGDRAGVALDLDGDGQSTGAEFLAGTNPIDPASSFRMDVEILTPSDQIKLAWPSVLGRTYRVETSSNLDGGSWTGVGSSLPGTGAPLTFYENAPSNGRRRFYRVGVE